MKVNLFTFAILLQLSLCIIATPQVNTTEQATTDKSVQVTTAAPKAADLTTGVTGKVDAVTKEAGASVTTVVPVTSTHETFKKINKKQKKDAKKSGRARKMKAASTESPREADFDDESAEDEELVQPRVSHRARGSKARTHATMKSRRHHWPRSEATYRSRTNRHRNKPIASWRSKDDDLEAKSEKSAEGGDCASTIECIMKNIDPKEFCCKDDNTPVAPVSEVKSAPESPPKSNLEVPPPSSVGGAPPPAPSQATPPPPPPSPPPQMCECTCAEDGSKISVTRGQFDSLKSSAAYRSALMHEAYNSYHWNPYNAYNQMPYMSRGPYAFGR